MFLVERKWSLEQRERGRVSKRVDCEDVGKLGGRRIGRYSDVP